MLVSSDNSPVFYIPPTNSKQGKVGRYITSRHVYYYLHVVFSAQPRAQSGVARNDIHDRESSIVGIVVVACQVPRERDQRIPSQPAERSQHPPAEPHPQLLLQADFWTQGLVYISLYFS